MYLFEWPSTRLSLRATVVPDVRFVHEYKHSGKQSPLQVIFGASWPSVTINSDG
ncbi:hypothetical protein DPMN_075051 [Dreissena polymorpha]|uniref:Uncharacterized protein n=1 Tax=Dreissena polymorpha TaxID=45954 RepID=A0A9D4BM47_DREPO|nr:hypothetical protein DPMN_075051 [Dreissena polymorpha]